MGKGKRNRERHKQQAAEDVVDIGALVIELTEANERQYLDLLRRRPGLLSDEVLDRLAEMRDGVDFGVILDLHHRLLIDSRTDPSSAWRQFRERGAELERQGQKLAPRLEVIEEALSEGRFEDVLELTDEARPEFAAAGLSLAIGRIHAQRGLAYVQLASGDARENADRAVIEFRLALELSPDDEQRARNLMHLGLAFGRRVAGDRADNLESAVAALSDALGLLGESAPPELLAVVRTNLATALLRREQGDPGENRAHAVDLCRQALEYRTPDRGAVDWAHTQLTLAGALEGLAHLDLATFGEAADAYGAVLSEQGRLQNESWLIASAHAGLGGLLRAQTEMPLEVRLKADEETIAAHEERVPHLLEESRVHLEAAAELGGETPDLIHRGRMLADLAKLYGVREERSPAIKRGFEAMELLTPISAPQECASIAAAVGAWLADEDEWQRAAAVYRVAVEATEISIHSRLATRAREEEIKRAGRLHRWASYALARVGAAQEAALILETGRTREVRRRLEPDEHSDARLGDLPPEIRERYEAAVADLAASPFGAGAYEAARTLQTVLTEIRYMPGLADFATGAQVADLTRAVEPGWPLVYVNPAPKGVLFVRVGDDGGATGFESRVLVAPGSLEVFMRVMTGTSGPSEWTNGMVSYMGEAAGFGEISGVRIREALEVTLPWVGEAIVKPLWDFIDRPELEGLTLVPCGPLTLLPLHACPWDEEGRAFCLLDKVPVRYAPSALLAGVSLDRARRRTGDQPSLLGLADPKSNLRAAVPEVRSIANLFPVRDVFVAEGAAATTAVLSQRVAGRSHVHLACHGRAGLISVEEAAIELADRPITALELAGLPDVAARACVISACQTAVAEFNDQPDEAISVGTALLAAGSACVVASLWSVDDAATAILMTRLYEQMLVSGEPPPVALRRAQLWLRDLNLEDEQRFLAGHPELEHEWRRRMEAGEPVGRRGPGAIESDRPYRHPDLWAPFIATGA